MVNAAMLNSRRGAWIPILFSCWLGPRTAEFLGDPPLFDHSVLAVLLLTIAFGILDSLVGQELEDRINHTWTPWVST